MKNINKLIIYYLSIGIFSVLLINTYCPMRQCTYSHTIEFSWLVLLSIPFIFSHRFFRESITKLIVFFIILTSIYYYGVYSSIIFLFLTILFRDNPSSKLNIILNFITAFILSLITYLFNLLYIEGVFF